MAIHVVSGAQCLVSPMGDTRHMVPSQPCIAPGRHEVYSIVTAAYHPRTIRGWSGIEPSSTRSNITESDNKSSAFTIDSYVKQIQLLMLHVKNPRYVEYYKTSWASRFSISVHIVSWLNGCTLVCARLSIGSGWNWSYINVKVHVQKGEIRTTTSNTLLVGGTLRRDWKSAIRSGSGWPSSHAGMRRRRASTTR